MAEQQTPNPGRAVVCVDGIVSSLFRNITPDNSWEAYVDWLELRRPELDVVWLRQPHDWFDILTGRALTYEDLIDQMVEATLKRLNPRWNEILIMGFSLGGLTALHVAREVARRAESLNVEYVAYVAMAAPWNGTGRLLDRLWQLMPSDYFEQLFDIETNRRNLRQLLLFGRTGRLRLLIGDIEHDEVVSSSSALMPFEWFAEWQPKGDFAAGAFHIRPRALLRPHDGLLHDPQAVAYIDGLVDGLFEPQESAAQYEPFSLRALRHARRVCKPSIDPNYVATDLV